MNKRQKQGAIIFGIAMLALGTGFAFFGGKKDEEDEEDDGCPPGMHRDPVTGECIGFTIDPTLCPPGQERVDGVCVAKCPSGQVRNAAGECVDITVVPPPDFGDIDDIIKPYPEGANFYQVKTGDWPGSNVHGSKIPSDYHKGLPVAGYLVRRETFLAAKEFGGLSNEAAMVFVNTHLGGSRLINPSGRTLDIILCSAFNDACYATWGYCGPIAIANGKCPASMQNHPGPNGRAIRLLTGGNGHPNNIKRIRDGQAVARYVGIGKPSTAGDASSKNMSGKKGYYPALWMPKLDRQRLYESTLSSAGFSSQIEIEISPETWDDGSSMSSPPPWVMKDGQLLDYSGTLNLPGAFGCAGAEFNFVPGG
jgi:hypothetical protein